MRLRHDPSLIETTLWREGLQPLNASWLEEDRMEWWTGRLKHQD
jgi:hypothetical protein